MLTVYDPRRRTSFPLCLSVSVLICHWLLEWTEAAGWKAGGGGEVVLGVDGTFMMFEITGAWGWKSRHKGPKRKMWASPLDGSRASTWWVWRTLSTGAVRPSECCPFALYFQSWTCVYVSIQSFFRLWDLAFEHVTKYTYISDRMCWTHVFIPTKRLNLQYLGWTLLPTPKSPVISLEGETRSIKVKWNIFMYMSHLSHNSYTFPARSRLRPWLQRWRTIQSRCVSVPMRVQRSNNYPPLCFIFSFGRNQRRNPWLPGGTEPWFSSIIGPRKLLSNVVSSGKFGGTIAVL